MAFVATPTNLFRPTEIPGCLLWLDANDPNGNGVVSTPGSVISSWVDKSGSGNTVTATGSPVFSNYQSRNAVYINNNRFSRSVTFPIANTTIFFVFCMSTPLGDRSYFQIGANPNNGGGDTTTFFSDANVARPGGTPAGRIYYGSGGTTFLTTQFPTATAADALPYCIQTARITSAPVVQNFRNGALQASQNGTVARVSHANLIIGSSNGGWQWTGFMSEIIMYNSALSETQRQQVEGYLGWKWNLQGNLPSSNAYFNTPLYSSYPFPALITPSINTVTPVPYGTNSATFLPPSLAGCSLWLDAADRTTYTLSGANVTLWRDKSGIGNNATAVGTITNSNNQMVWNTATGTRFQGSMINTGTTGSLFMIMSVTGNSQNRWFFSASPNSSTVTFGSLTAFNIAMQSGGTSFRAYRNNGNLSFGNFSNTNTLFFYANIFDGASNTTFTNGTAGTPVASSGSFNIGFYEVGSSIAEENLISFDGTVGEVIYYTSALTTAQRQQVEGYLAWKWGLTASLPNGHPFKTPPLAPFSYAIRQAAQGKWSPLNLTNCALWLDAADTSTVVLSGSSIILWVDKSGNVRNATSPGGLTTNAPSRASAFLNKLDVISFSASPGQCLNLNNFNSVPLTIYIVLRFNSTGNSGFAINFQSTGGFNPTWRNTGANSIQSIGIDNGNGTSRYFANPPVNDTNWHIMGFTLPSNALGQLRMDGIVGAASATAFTYPENLTIGLPCLGAFQQIPTNSSFTGQIAEVLWYNSVVSISNLENIEGYLAWKWGLQSSLPSNHPYRNFPPSPQ